MKECIKVDFHTHSTASDGMDSPRELVNRAACENIKVLALTDHDTIAGLAEAEDAARDLGIYFIRGCEISVTTPFGNAHILGLWIPQKADILENFFKHMRILKGRRNAEIINKLARMGIHIEEAEKKLLENGFAGRPHLAHILIQKKHASSFEDAFIRFLGAGGKAHVPKTFPLPEDALNILKILGSTSVVAHPLRRNMQIANAMKLINSLGSMGVDAIEAWHVSHTREQSRYLLELAIKAGFLVTGGSDYHGIPNDDSHLGYGGGNELIPSAIFEDLLNARKEKGLEC